MLTTQFNVVHRRRKAHITKIVNMTEDIKNVLKLKPLELNKQVFLWYIYLEKIKFFKNKILYNLKEKMVEILIKGTKYISSTTFWYYNFFLNKNQ